MVARHGRPIVSGACCSIKTADGVRTAMEADAYIKSLKFSGATALGTAIEQRVITPFVVQPAQQNRLAKPVLVIWCSASPLPAQNLHLVAPHQQHQWSAAM